MEYIQRFREKFEVLGTHLDIRYFLSSHLLSRTIINLSRNHRNLNYYYYYLIGIYSIVDYPEFFVTLDVLKISRSDYLFMSTLIASKSHTPLSKTYRDFMDLL